MKQPTSSAFIPNLEALENTTADRIAAARGCGGSSSGDLVSTRLHPIVLETLLSEYQLIRTRAESLTQSG